MRHPYLTFSESDVKTFRERLENEPELKARYEKAVSETEKCLCEEFITEEQANGRNTQSQHADFGSLNGQAGRLCSVLGLKYLVDGDKRCAQRLKELLIHLTGFERWFGVSYTRRFPVPWHSDLCSAATTLALARIYDIIYDSLSEEERRSLADGILEKGVYPTLGDWVFPETRIHAIDSMGHNWWAVCIAEAAAAFLAVSDFVPEDRKNTVLGLVDTSLAQYLTYPGNRLFNKQRNFDEQGLFYESINYDNFGTGSLLVYLRCRERYYGRNETIRAAIPAGLCDAVMKLSYPYTKDGKLCYDFENYGDHSPGTCLDYLIKNCLLLGIDTSAARAYAKTFTTDIWEELTGPDLKNISGSLDYLPKAALFSSGFAVKRSGWEPDATMFSVKSGYCWNHSHNDAGTFVIRHKGKAFFTDSGTCSYDSPLYHDYYCQDCAHSVIRIGGEGRRDEELYRGTRFPGSLTDSFESGDLFFVQADSTGPMAHLCSRLYRNFLWFDDRLLVIFDDIYCHKDSTAEFTLHFDGEYSADGNTVDFTNGISRARLISHEPREMKLCEKAGHADHEENRDIPYIELCTAEEQRTHLLIHTLELDPQEHDTKYERLESPNALGLRITDAGTEREIWFNTMADGHIMHDNSNNVISGFDTDAYMLVITRDKNSGSERVLMICGSYLRKDGKVYISSFIKETKEVKTEQ